MRYDIHKTKRSFFLFLEKGNKEKTEVMLLSVPDTQHLPPTSPPAGGKLLWPFKVKQNKLSHFLSKEEGQLYVVVVVVCVCRNVSQEHRVRARTACFRRRVHSKGNTTAACLWAWRLSGGCRDSLGGNVCTSK